MKRLSIVGLTALLVSAPLVGELPGFTAAQNAVQVLAQNVQSKPQVQLSLNADKKIVTTEQGKQQVTWQKLQGNVVVQPGDVIRYTVTGANNSDRVVKNLVVTQPIPKQTAYVMNSTTVQNNAAKITYSIDNGKTFVEKPTVKVKLSNGKVETRPAPAELYTQIRWKFDTAINPKAAVNGTYQVRVR